MVCARRVTCPGVEWQMVLQRKVIIASILVPCAQESPTKELAEQPFPGVTEPPAGVPVLQKDISGTSGAAERTSAPSNNNSERSLSDLSKGRDSDGKPNLLYPVSWPRTV